MPLSAGSRIGPYEVTAEIGAGGMGVVYRAHDTKLGRDVALKTLPEHFARDPARLARFQREAQVLASLNHPNIAIIHGLEEADGVQALVLELVEGPTLAEVIVQGAAESAPSPLTTAPNASEARQAVGVGPHRKLKKAGLALDEALRIARQVAEALEAAHEQGVIHRDLKPANIKLRPDGTVKVLDFGLAKMLDPFSAEGREGWDAAALAQSPTITSPATQAGVILGTAAYMAPEQAKGKAVDKRADIWAFGCVLYEMLTGRRAFLGDDVSEVFAAVIKVDPDWSGLPADTPPAIRRLLRHCLEKDRRERLHDIGDARIDIRDASQATDVGVAQVGATAPHNRERLAWSVAALLFIVASLAATIAVFQGPADDEAAFRASILLPAPLGPAAPDARLALSPDGRRLAFVAPGSDGRRMLWVRPLDSLVAQPLDDTVGASSPFWSPDSRIIAFFADRRLKKIDAAGGPALTLVDDVTLFPPMGPTGVAMPLGGTWSKSDWILFGRSSPPYGLYRVSASGGTASPVTVIDPERGEIRHAVPFFLPDRRHFLYTAVGRQSSTVYVGSLDDSLKKLVLEGTANAKYANGLLVFARGSTLMAQPFDDRRLELDGAAQPIAEQVVSNQNNLAAFSVSETGVLAYETGRQTDVDDRTLVWLDRQGREEPLGLEPDSYAQPRLSPDGTRLAVSRVDNDGNEDVWVYDLARGTSTRLSFGPAHDTPLWTADGKRVIFRRLGDGLVWAAADGTGEIEVLRKTPYNAAAYSLPAGTHLIFMENFPETRWDIYAIALDGERAVQPLLQSPFEEMRPAVSPDGRWLAYSSNESGEHRIYVRPFPNVNDGKWTISSSAGTSPIWGSDGRELFFRSGDAMMRVPVETSPTFSPGPRQVLFEYSFLPEVTGARFGRSFDIAPDGERFLIVKADAAGENGTPGQIVVVVNGLRPAY